jgi:hypothetical protein
MGTTSFTVVYDSFFNRVTDSMYVDTDMTEVEVFEQLQPLLINGLHRFEFPRFDLYDYEEGQLEDVGIYNGYESDYKDATIIAWVGGQFNSELTQEEINILALCMVVEWFETQLANTELTREKYSGSDFKFTSQANHMAKLKNMIEYADKDLKHMQRLYKRRVMTESGAKSTMAMIMQPPTYGLGIDE